MDDIEQGTGDRETEETEETAASELDDKGTAIPKTESGTDE